MLFKAAALLEQELRVIGEIGEMYKSLRYVLSIPTRWQGTLRRNAFARAIRGSNSVEGYKVTVEDALAVAEGEQPSEAELETLHAVTGYRNAMTYVLQICKIQNFKMSEDYLRSLHFMMMHYDLSKHPGLWRSGPVYVRDDESKVVVYDAPPAEKAAILIKELISYLNSSEDSNHLLIKGAMAHLNLVMIHPFADGNGRMARCLHTFSVAKIVSDPTFSSVEEYIGKNTMEYYKVLAQVGNGSWNPQNNTRPWIRFILTAHYRQAATFLQRNRLLAKLWGELESEIKSASLPERAMLALSDAAVGLKVRTSHYGHLAEVNSVGAARDLRAMVDSGLLVARGEKRGRFYLASERIRQIAINIRQQEPLDIPDPFEETER